VLNKAGMDLKGDVYFKRARAEQGAERRRAIARPSRGLAIARLPLRSIARTSHNSPPSPE